MGVGRASRSIQRTSWIGVATIALSVGAPGCGGEDDDQPRIASEASEAAVAASAFPSTAARQWMTNLALSVKFDTISPPVAARTYTYGAIAIYESLVHGMPGYQSLAGQLNGLDSLPVPNGSLTYDWPTVLAHTMHLFVNDGPYVYPNRLFYEYTTPVQASLTTLGPVQIAYRRAAGVPEDVINNSLGYAEQLAGALIAWADEDGYYDVRYKGYVPPKGDDKWVPTGFSDLDKVANPAEPYFGTLRPLVLVSPDECAPPPPPPFSTNPTSAMFAEANAVYQTEQNLTDEQREIANFWADGPGATPTPAGHWLALATKYLRTRNLADAAAGYAYTSLGYYDSFIAIWQGKYTYNLLRPETYIRRHIDPGWRPFLPTPQFPSYMSGHSGQSSAAAVLFTEWLGDDPVNDNTKLRRGFAARDFANFTAAAQEAADSRIYGGIHYPMDDLLTQGLCVGNLIKERVHLTM